MFCRKCGAEIRLNAKFCAKCGTMVPNRRPIEVKPIKLTLEPGTKPFEEKPAPKAPEAEPKLISTMPKVKPSSGNGEFNDWFSDPGDL